VAHRRIARYNCWRLAEQTPQPRCFCLLPTITPAGPQAGVCSLPSSLLQTLLKVQAAYVLSDPRQPDCPIVHASPEFLALTGYSREEVEGRNCRFLQVGGSSSQRTCVVHVC
jgi:PAS domain-containing protein